MRKILRGTQLYCEPRVYKDEYVLPYWMMYYPVMNFKEKAVRGLPLQRKGDYPSITYKGKKEQ